MTLRFNRLHDIWLSNKLNQKEFLGKYISIEIKLIKLFCDLIDILLH